MILGSVISLMDQNYYGHLMVFMINILSCCGLCVMNIKQSLVSILVSSSILIVALPFFQHSKNILTMHYFNLVLFIPICIGVSRVVYSRYCTNYRNNQRLKKQTSINKIINSKLKRANELLEQISTIDELTQIPNRRGLKNYIDVTLKYYGNRSFEFSTIMMDIDNFKGFNDNYGHHEGDKVLISIARKINSVASDSSGFTARWGGEEFIYVAFNMDKKSTLKVAEIMRKAVVDLKILHEYSKTSSFVTISLGVFSMNINDKKDIKTCMEKADKALYIAKRSGRNCFRYYQ